MHSCSREGKEGGGGAVEGVVEGVVEGCGGGVWWRGVVERAVEGAVEGALEGVGGWVGSVGGGGCLLERVDLEDLEAEDVEDAYTLAARPLEHAVDARHQPVEEHAVGGHGEGGPRLRRLRLLERDLRRRAAHLVSGK
jgi:hypothetical protein